jgi:hypothetical protein
MAFTQGHALLIGVGTHQYEPRIDVPITVDDAQAVATVLQDANLCGYPAAQVKFIHDADATKKGILSELDELAKRVGENDTVFLFYAGHGALGEDSNYYLVSHDARINGDRVVDGTGVSEAELLEKLRSLKARRALMIFNACFSGNISPTLALDDGTPSLATSNPDETTLSALLGTGSGRIIITACREDQKSYIGSGALTIFTQTLVDGLRGKGVTNKRGFISVYDLYETLYDTVSTTVKETKKKEQEPELTVNKGVGPLAVALYKGAKTLGIFDETEAAPSTGAVRQVDPAKSQRIFQQKVQQSGGVNFGQGNEFHGPVAGGDQTIVDAQGSQGLVNQPTGPVTQTFGPQIDTGGGAYVTGGVNTGGGGFTGRDHIVHGDVITTGNLSGTGIALGSHASATVTTGIDAAALGAALTPVAEAVRQSGADAATQAQAMQMIDELKQELSKGKDKSNDGQVANVLKGLTDLVPGAVSAVVSAFATPVIGGLAGPVAKFFLDSVLGGK